MTQQSNKQQRIRDPLHNLIPFDQNRELERTLWRVLCSRPFQRLRRIKQLGFSDLVYPSATHSRFAHSVGVFHTARQLMAIVRDQSGEERSDTNEYLALAAALVHDVGHGPFSHAFEAVGNALDLELADHERMSDMLIREGEITEILKEMGSGFADDVADMIGKRGRRTVYSAVVSSQFDADRLDYIRRDRLMTGSHHSAIDFEWLLANLELVDIRSGEDQEDKSTLKTFVIGPKAIQAAEAYVLGLFQLYPTVYFHKATRGMEKFFSDMLVRLVQLVQDGGQRMTGLPDNHPIMNFARSPEDIDVALQLDDTVVWGALSQMREAEDALVQSFAGRLQDRKLYKCVDIGAKVAHELDPENKGDKGNIGTMHRCCTRILSGLADLKEETRTSDGVPMILTDVASRFPYREDNDEFESMERIWVRSDGGALMDLLHRSQVIGALREYALSRAYFDRNRDDIGRKIQNIVDREVKACR